MGEKKDTHVSMYIGWQALGPLKYGYITGEEKYKLKDQSQNIYLPSYRKEYISAFDLSKIVTPMATGRSRSISFLMNVAKSVSSSRIATLLRKGLPRASQLPFSSCYDPCLRMRLNTFDHLSYNINIL